MTFPKVAGPLKRDVRRRGVKQVLRVTALLLVAALGCERRDCSRVVAAHGAVKPGMTLVEAIAITEAAQLPDLEWIVRSSDSGVPPFEVSREPYRIRFYNRPRQQHDGVNAPPYQESGYGSRSEFLAALNASSDRLAGHRRIEITMRCVRGGLNWEVFTIELGPDEKIVQVSGIEHVRF